MRRGTSSPGRDQECRPINRVEAHDILADDMQVGGPIPAKHRAFRIGIADRGDVVGQSVDPHIHHVLGIDWDLHAPVERGARDREVLQATLDEAHHLVEPFLGQYIAGIVRIEIQQFALVGREAKEIAFLLDPFHRRLLRTDPLTFLVDSGLVLVVVRLITDRVPPGIFVEIDITCRLHPLPNCGRSSMVALFRRANEVVVRTVEPLDHCLEMRNVALDQLPRSELLLRRRLQQLDAVLIGAGEEEHIVAIEPLEAGNRVGGDGFIGVADMWRAIRIGDGRGQVEAGLVSHRVVRTRSLQYLIPASTKGERSTRPMRAFRPNGYQANRPGRCAEEGSAFGGKARSTLADHRPR